MFILVVNFCQFKRHQHQQRIFLEKNSNFVKFSKKMLKFEFPKHFHVEHNKGCVTQWPCHLH
jgi:hypothetical protein